MDEDNFKIILMDKNLNKFEIEMSDGYLIINNSSYEELDDDPTYAMARELFKMNRKIVAMGG